ncbi:hypothetical protein H5410_028384 [Solanum commersonii]|uniref:Uncharacterized protein n=1 Tax=Solanum commersonii TaxID=4109 RepID=A0A9J5Z602_SOLCO|nr:hypothetical protein H5410_028384 [Solanum commersonii]
MQIGQGHPTFGYKVLVKRKFSVFTKQESKYIVILEEAFIFAVEFLTSTFLFLAFLNEETASSLSLSNIRQEPTIDRKNGK